MQSWQNEELNYWMMMVGCLLDDFVLALVRVLENYDGRPYQCYHSLLILI